MYNIYFVGPKLVGTKWENLTFKKYYEEMSDEERQELRKYLESINSPYGDDILEEDDPGGAFSYKAWRDIVSMSDDELEYWNQYWEERDSGPAMPEIECDNYDDLPF